MKKFLILLLLAAKAATCCAIDHDKDSYLSYLNLEPGSTTQAHVTSMLGKPSKIEQNRKRTWWYYEQGKSNLVISWNKKSQLLERFIYNCKQVEKTAFDNQVQGKLQSGATGLLQAVKLLGGPVDMTIKEATQEVHYAYQNSVLRLFFRDRVLVDYTLLSQN